MSMLVQAIISCDQVFIIWHVDVMIPNCAGFAVFREVDGKDPVPLETWVGFADENPDTSGKHSPSTVWPIQKTSWIDYGAPAQGELRYGVLPVLLQADQTVVPEPMESIVWSDVVSLGGDVPAISGWFNRGTIAAQWLSRALGVDTSPARHLSEVIEDPADPIRTFLGGRALERLLGHMETAAREQRPIFAALFELSDPQLKGALESLRGLASLVLGNSDGGGSTNEKNTDESADQLTAQGVKVVRRAIAPSRYAHNKFVVFTGADGKPERVWTGSINWTETGVCTQASNGLDILDADVAQAFYEHWKLLHDAGAKPVVDNGPHSFTIDKVPADVWFTPVADDADLAAARTLINNAKSGILFLMLNPGPSGLLGPIIERLSKADLHYDPDLYIRGVLNNFPQRGGDQTPADQISLLTSAGTRQNFTAEDLAAVMKPAHTSKTADWWLAELANTQRFNIAVHSKVIVIDPGGEAPIVMTGSHNFSSRASEKNDDNLVIIQGDRDLARAYAVNIIGIYNEYRWRAWRNTPAGQEDHGLKRSDAWLSSRVGAPWYERESLFWMGKAQGSGPG